MFLKSFSNYICDNAGLIKAFPTITGNFLSIFLKKQITKNPLVLSWAPTLKCQANCMHCLLKWKGDVLSAEENLSVADKIGKSNIWGVIFTGGEPMIVPELFEIAKILKNNNKKIILSTNGILLKENAENIIKYIDTVVISIDGLEKTHDKLRQVPGCYNKIEEGLKYIKENSKGKKILTSIRCVISKYNYKEIPEFIEKWQNRVNKIVFQPVQNNVFLSVKNKEILLGKEDKEPFENLWRNAQKKYSFLNNAYYKLLPEFIFNPEQLRQKINWHCLPATTFTFIVVPNGNVIICPGHKSLIGNLKNMTIEEIWKNTETYKKQSEIRNSNCICWCTHSNMTLFMLNIYNLFNKQ